MRNRRGTALCIAVLTALLLSGCDVAASLVDKTGIELGLQKLTSQLEEVPSVRTVTPTATLNGDLSYTVHLRVEVDELVEADVVDVVTSVATAFGNAPFTGTKELSFELSASPEEALSEQFPLRLSSAELVSEIHYWFALTAAYGAPLAMYLYPDPDGNASPAAYVRTIFQLGEATDVNWDALRAVPDESKALRGWGLGGIGSEGALPPAEVVTLADALAAIATSETEEYRLDFYRPGEIWVTAHSPADPEDLSTSEGWPRLLAALRLILAEEPPLTQLTYYGAAEDGRSAVATLYLGRCANPGEARPADVALVEALSASNLDLTAGIGAGSCSNA